MIRVVGVALFLTAGLFLSTEVLAQETHRVDYGNVPMNGIGGTLTVSGGVEDRDRVAEGTVLTFTATPSWKFYVYKWNHPGCTETGNAEKPGVAQQCVVTVNARLRITATFAESAIRDRWHACLKTSETNFNLSCGGGCPSGNSLLRDEDGNALLSWECPNSDLRKHCDDVSLCMYSGFTEEVCLKTVEARASLAECHTRGPEVCREEAEREVGGVCIPFERVTVIAPFPPPPKPPSAVGLSLNVVVHPLRFAVFFFTYPPYGHRAIISGYEILREENMTGNFVSVGFAPGHERNFYVDQNAPHGVTLRYKVRVESDPGPGPISGASPSAIIPVFDEGEARDCAAVNRYPTLDPQKCGGCLIDPPHDLLGGLDGLCVPLKGGFGGLSQEVLCSAFGGVTQEEGDGKICFRN